MSTEQDKVTKKAQSPKPETSGDALGYANVREIVTRLDDLKSQLKFAWDQGDGAGWRTALWLIDELIDDLTDTER